MSQTPDTLISASHREHGAIFLGGGLTEQLPKLEHPDGGRVDGSAEEILHSSLVEGIGVETSVLQPLL